MASSQRYIYAYSGTYSIFPVKSGDTNSVFWYMFHMELTAFTDRIRSRLSEIEGTAVGVAVQAGLPRDAIRSVFRGHPPSLPRAGEICRALGITVTIGARRVRPQSEDSASNSQHAASPSVAPDVTRAEHFAQVVDGQLADLFEEIAHIYEKARTDAERKLVFEVFSGVAGSTRRWTTSFVESDEPPHRAHHHAWSFGERLVP